jgi:ABC-type nickel/cobalt efflux system permease component RcnA
VNDLTVDARRTGVAIPLCVLANVIVAVAVLNSRWGSVFMLDDDFHNSSIVVSMVVGLALGLIQSLIFGPQIAIAAAGISLVGVFTLVLAFTLVTQMVGVALGCLLAWTARRYGARIRRRE